MTITQEQYNKIGSFAYNTKDIILFKIIIELLNEINENLKIIAGKE